MSPAFGLVIPDVQFVIPDSIRDPHHHWIAGQARNDKTMRMIWLVWHSAQELLGSDTNSAKPQVRAAAQGAAP